MTTKKKQEMSAILLRDTDLGRSDDTILKTITSFHDLDNGSTGFVGNFSLE
jgi:hypothetical protein